MDKIIDYLESFTLSLELSGSDGAIKVDRINSGKVNYLFVYDRFIYNSGNIIKISFDKVSGNYYICPDKYLYKYSILRYNAREFNLDTEEKVLNVLKDFIKIIEEQFVDRSNKYSLFLNVKKGG